MKRYEIRTCVEDVRTNFQELLDIRHFRGKTGERRFRTRDLKLNPDLQKCGKRGSGGFTHISKPNSARTDRIDVPKCLMEGSDDHGSLTV